MLAGSRLFLTYDFTVIPVPMLITARDDVEWTVSFLLK